jgi:quinol monooxygenase YgiN
MPYAVVATYVSKPDEVGALANHLRAMIEPTNDEEGCETYRVIHSIEDPTTFVLFEIYRDEAAYQAHFASDHFEQHVRNGAWNCLLSRTVIRGTELSAT